MSDLAIASAASLTGANLASGDLFPVLDVSALAGSKGSNMTAAEAALGLLRLGEVGVHGADIASASTIDLDAATGDVVDVTGTTTITAVTLADGKRVLVRFTGALTLTHGASLVLPTGANITTKAGDYALFVGYASSVVRVVWLPLMSTGGAGTADAGKMVLFRSTGGAAFGSNTTASGGLATPIVDIGCSTGRALGIAADGTDSQGIETTMNGLRGIGISGHFNNTGCVGVTFDFTNGTGIGFIGAFSGTSATDVGFDVDFSGGVGIAFRCENWQISAAGIQSNLHSSKIKLTPATHTYASTITLDFSSNSIETVTLTGNLTIDTSNLSAGTSKTLRIIGDGSTRTLTFPAGWKFVGEAAPASLAAGKIAILTMTSFSTTDANVVAAYAAEP